MKLIFGNWCFCPRLITSLFALVFFILFICLGLWQLDRAEDKRTLHQAFLVKQDMAAIDLVQALSIEHKTKQLWRHVIANGQFNEDKQILLDNQVVSGKPGYFVYTPFKINGAEQHVLINRGWLASGLDRSKVPDLAKVDSIVTINGVIKEPPKTGVLLKELPPEQLDENTLRVQKLDVKQLQEFIGKELLPFIIRLEPDSDHGYRRDWRLPGSGEQVHQGYAFQWFAFASTLLIIYLVVNTKKVD